MELPALRCVLKPARNYLSFFGLAAAVRAYPFADSQQRQRDRGTGQGSDEASLLRTSAVPLTVGHSDD